MTDSTEGKKFEQIVKNIDLQSKLLRTWQLEGGVSAQVTALEIERTDGQKEQLILRRYGAADLKQHPTVAVDEFKVLKMLEGQLLATPKAYLVDQSGEIFPTPYIVIECIDGKTADSPSDLSNFIVQLATHLVKIHTIDCSSSDFFFLPTLAERLDEKLKQHPDKLDDALDEGRIRTILESMWPLRQLNTSVLLHGDFWPGNTLWRDGQLVGIIDWEDAVFGDPLADVSNCRLEILWAFGHDAMDEFTTHYRARTAIDFTNLPFWDLYAALRPCSKLSTWGLDEMKETHMRKLHTSFVNAACEKLSVQSPTICSDPETEAATNY